MLIYRLFLFFNIQPKASSMNFLAKNLNLSVINPLDPMFIYRNLGDGETNNTYILKKPHTK